MFQQSRQVYSLTLLFASLSASAAHPLKFVGTLTGGAAWESAGETQTLFLSPTIEKKYVADETTDVLGEGEIFLGAQYTFAKHWQTQFGLAFAIMNPATLTGDIWDDAEPEFNNYEYSYMIKQSRLAVKGKLLRETQSRFIPWISASLGASFNESYDFENNPTITEATSTPNFASESSTSFTYAVGVGVQYEFTKHWQAGIAYEFADWGQSELGLTSGQTMTDHLELDHFYTNSLLLNITYLG